MASFALAAFCAALGLSESCTSSEAAKTKSGHILRGPILKIFYFFTWYLWVDKLPTL
jgi:hypothetical protein